MVGACMVGLTRVELVDSPNPSTAVPLPTIECAFCAGPRTAKFSMFRVWFGVNFALAGCPASTSQTSTGRYEGVSRVPTFTTGMAGLTFLPYSIHSLLGSDRVVEGERNSPFLKNSATLIYFPAGAGPALAGFFPFLPSAGPEAD